MLFIRVHPEITKHISAATNTAKTGLMRCTIYEQM